MFNHQKKILLFSIMIIGVLMVTPLDASATVEVGKSNCITTDPTVVLNTPLPNQVFNPGDTVNFSGLFYEGAGGGLLTFFYRLNFYITEDRIDIPITDCMDRPLGYLVNCGSPDPDDIFNPCSKPIPTPNVFLNPWQCNEYGTDLYCKNTMFLNTDAPGYNIAFLGEDECANPDTCTIDYFDFGGGIVGEYHMTRTVNFDFSFTIPYGFSGPVRFYVTLYNGWHYGHLTGLASQSHWLILYQPAIITNNSPNAAISCDPPGCKITPGEPLDFINDSTDPDGIGDIAKSEWYVKEQGEPDTEYELKKSCSDNCNYTPLSDITETIGDYVVKLYVEDTAGASDIATKGFSVESSIENDPPQAAISCSCQGSDPQNCNPSTCEVFRGSDVFTLQNDSTDPDGDSDIGQSKWYVKQQSDPDYPVDPVATCSNACNYTSQETPGEYTAKLIVKDMAGETDEDTEDFRIKQDIESNFQCSLDNSTWLDCSDSSFKVILADTVLYLKDTSIPSEDSDISSRTWTGKYYDETPIDNFQYEEEDPSHTNPSFTVAKSGKMYVSLEVVDSNGRISEIEQSIGSIPPPKWWPAFNGFPLLATLHNILSGVLAF